MEPWMWIVAALWLAAAITLWSTLAIAAISDELSDRIQAEERARRALGRAAAQAKADNVVPIRPDST